MGTFPLDTNIVSSGNIPSILMTGYLLGTFPLDTAGMAVYTWDRFVPCLLFSGDLLSYLQT